MMNYFRLIEPYLFGKLCAEEQLAFERQLVRNPALANEFTIRFSLVRVLLANPEHPFRKLQQKKDARRSPYLWIWLACAFSALEGLLLGFVLS
ncbi:MAG: hypothetical protein KF734_21100 [Saprospiraceae bacterium]|nr:hypothetical protein [Saprospiraceae bacterium]